MITPTDITNFSRSQAELEEFLLFAVLVAGKTARIQAQKLEQFLQVNPNLTPFEHIRSLEESNMLDHWIRQFKLGQYNRLGKAFRSILMFQNKLDTVTLDELESVAGIGPKTARFFLLHSRPNQKMAALDTHILKFMASKGHKVPKSTPPKKQYNQIEKDFLAECEQAGKSVAEMDLQIWEAYSEKSR
jgi:thermostable 8-oxoguanine DNA glycosylase